MHAWKARNWQTQAGRTVCNVDLWMELDKLLAEREAETVWFKKVVGHAKDADVASGRVLYEDKLGNDAVDRLAVAGALLHHATGAERRQAQLRLGTAWRIQRMMVEILQARAVKSTDHGPGFSNEVISVSSSTSSASSGSDTSYTSE